MTTNNSANTVRFPLIDRLLTFARRRLSFSRSVTTARDAARDLHPSMLAISAVDDPDGTGRLVGVRGTVTPGNATRLLGATDGLFDGHGLHIDLTDAAIPTIGALRQLEALFDELERRGLHLRVAGIDPALPVLVAVG